ncbi:hypothetical protein BDN72DRAFT_865780 [Pluteus cervinus]|uniref:Uncharacterized protein n=1 Tax=Pluteus cervinus TaxID=181527 RepID=A0ACD2ZZ09_9AGAR|nr:hypothetical protein BDN72DRAFT_865780 [Pluteus cervinus]
MNNLYQPDLEKHIKEMANDADQGVRQRIVNDLIKLDEATKALNTFHKDISTLWARSDDCVIGHTIYSPPIELGFGEGRYTQDFASGKIACLLTGLVVALRVLTKT